MTELTLTRRTAFGAIEPQIRAVGNTTLSERPDVALASLTARNGKGAAIAAEIETRCGAPCPVGSFVQSDGMSAVWTGPNQWFLLADHSEYEQLSTALKTDLGDTASVTEQNDGWVVFDLTGDALRDILERLCNVDLTALGAGRAQRTVIEHVPCFLLSLEPNRSYRLLCGRSYAASFIHAISLAMEAAHSLSLAPPR